MIRLWPTKSERLLRRAGRGDSRALDRLYEDNVDGLYAFVYGRVGRDAARAEDVVQETFCDALAHPETYDPERGELRTWLCWRSRNIIRRHTDARLVATWDRIDEALATAFATLDEQPLSDEILERAETRDLVNTAAANLPERYREILERKYVDGASLEEIGAALALSPEAAKSLLARARRAFREAFLTLTRTMAEEQP